MTGARGIIGSIDTRKFPAHVLLKQSSIEKTVLRYHKTTPHKLSNETKPILPEPSSDTFIEFYVSSAPTSSNIRVLHDERDLEVDPFVEKCFESFQYFADKNAESVSQSETISITQLGKAIQRIIYTITPSHINGVADYFGLLDDPNTMLSWDDFKQFLRQVLKTQPGVDEVDENRFHDQKKDDQKKDSEHSKAFHSEVRKLMKSNSSQSELSSEYGGNSGSNLEPVANGNTVYLSSLSGGPGLNASKNFAKDEMVDIYRREEIFKRKLRMKDEKGD
jgi:hypothetical protein